MTVYVFLVVLSSFLHNVEFVESLTSEKVVDEDQQFYLKEPPQVPEGFKTSSLHSFGFTCTTISNRLYQDRNQAWTNVTSRFERRGVGITDDFLNEDRVLGMMHLHNLWLDERDPVFHIQEFPSPQAILVTDPKGNKHYLKNWLHIRLEIPTDILENYHPEYLFAHMLRRSLHHDWENAAPQGQFVYDFPGYTECEDIRGEIESGVAQRPTPYQFLPCQGANSGDNEFANTFFYDFRAPVSHGGSDSDANGFKKVIHLFWKFNDNVCSRKYHEFKFQVMLVVSYKNFRKRMVPFFFTQFVASIGNVHESRGKGNVPSQAYDPLPPVGGGWKWDCSVPFERTTNRLSWVYEIFPKVDQEPVAGEMGSCRPNPLSDDSFHSGFEDGKMFSGRCDSKRYGKGGNLHNTPHISTPSPDVFHYCQQEANLAQFFKSDPIPRQYEELFGATFIDNGNRIEVTPEEICNKCPTIPTQEQISQIFSEAVELEGKDKSKVDEILEMERQKELKRQQEEELKRLEAIREALEKKNSSNSSAPQLSKVFTVRFDDEDDGWWGGKTGIQVVGKNHPRSIVAQVGLSVWRFRQLHGILEVIVTFFTTPICIFVSRYFKETWLGTRVLEQPTWLMVHLCFSILSVIFHVFGVHSGVKGTSMMGRSRELYYGTIHRTLGFVTLAVFVLLNLLGAFRPVNLIARRVTIVLHSLFGLLGYCLNFACVLTSISLPGSPSSIEDVSLHTTFQTGKVEIIFVLCIVWILIDLFLHSIALGLLCLSDSKGEVKRSYVPVLMSVVDEDEHVDLEGSWKRQMLFLIYVIASCTMTIVVVAIMYSQVQYGRAFLKTTVTHNESGDLYGNLLEENKRQRHFPNFV